MIGNSPPRYSPEILSLTPLPMYSIEAAVRKASGIPGKEIELLISECVLKGQGFLETSLRTRDGGHHFWATAGPKDELWAQIFSDCRPCPPAKPLKGTRQEEHPTLQCDHSPHNQAEGRHLV